jgi:lipopolysaccharide transport system permease protein
MATDKPSVNPAFGHTNSPVFLIRPTRGWASLQLREVWTHRELLYFLGWRDVKVRYKQTVLGFSWAILQPLTTMIVFTIFFGRLANVGSDGLPYPLFSFAGLLPWNLFAQGVTQTSGSLVGSSNLINKVYFPRLIIPISSIFVSLVDFCVGLLFLAGLMVWYHTWPSPNILLLPLFALLATSASLGIGMWLAALNVKYRDIRYVVPFFVQLCLFITPVIYPASRVVFKLKEMGLPTWIYGLNPMAGAVEGFRWAAVGKGSAPMSVIAASLAVTLILLVSGAYYFRRTERTFADVV